jgi:hypothetical protein
MTSIMSPFGISNVRDDLFLLASGVTPAREAEAECMTEVPNEQELSPLACWYYIWIVPSM